MNKESQNAVVRNFFVAQFEVFDRVNAILETCRKNIDKTGDIRLHDLSKSIITDLMKFELEFSEFDADLRNYVYNVGDARGVIDQVVTESGLADHKEYFFQRIERCVSDLEDVVTEIKAAGYEWEDVNDLLLSMERLFDASEALIEVDPNDLDDPEFANLVGKIPPQRLAPIEVIVTPSVIKRKPPSTHSNRQASLEQARRALVEVFGDVKEDISKSNADSRIKNISERILRELDTEFGNFSPIILGINIGMMRTFTSAIIEEFGDVSAAYILSGVNAVRRISEEFQLLE